MGYLTINARSNRVVVISSVITRIFFNSVQCLDSHFSAYFNKDTHDLFMLCIMLVCQLYRVDLLLFFDLFCSLFDFYSSFVHLLFDFCFHSIILLFIVQRKRFNSDPGLYSRYFDSIVREVPVHHHLCKSNKHHTLDCTDFVLV
jgi:hypothetical protein